MVRGRTNTKIGKASVQPDIMFNDMFIEEEDALRRFCLAEFVVKLGKSYGSCADRKKLNLSKGMQCPTMYMYC